MEDAQDLFHESLGEVEKLLSARSVVGDAITVEGTTIIPLVATGFGFGAGGGGGKAPGDQGEGNGAGTGAGGGVRPVALVIVERGGNVRVERVTGPSRIESIGTAIAKAMETRGAPKAE
jgi:uncharacterized spore protein YtfJ